jgi:hypothetical protein
MKRAGVDVLRSAMPGLPPEELVTRIYEAMAYELAMVPIGDRM